MKIGAYDFRSWPRHFFFVEQFFCQIFFCRNIFYRISFVHIFLSKHFFVKNLNRNFFLKNFSSRKYNFFQIFVVILFIQIFFVNFCWEFLFFSKILSKITLDHSKTTPGQTQKRTSRLPPGHPRTIRCAICFNHYGFCSICVFGGKKSDTIPEIDLQYICNFKVTQKYWATRGMEFDSDPPNKHAYIVNSIHLVILTKYFV